MDIVYWFGCSWANLSGITFHWLMGCIFGCDVWTVEQGGQVGIVFEMYRDSVGFFRLMEETIESNLKEEEADRRENGELLEVKVALQLGRSLSEPRDLVSTASSLSSGISPDEEEFGSKLF